jgi:electron transport complex protein RnfC
LALILYRSARGSAVKLPDYGISPSSPIERPSPPPEVWLPLFQQNGSQCNAIVKKGDTVLAGQKIADGEDFATTPVHATISGEVTGIVKLIQPASGRPVDTIVITSDGQDKSIKYKTVRSNSPSTKDNIEIIRQAGISGNEADNIPAHIRLSPPQDRKIDTVIINGSQCEPYLMTDNHLMQENLNEVLAGANAINKILSPTFTYITIDPSRRDIVDRVLNITASSGLDNFRVVLLKPSYPSTVEGNLVNVVLGREIPTGATAADVGVAVFSARTVRAINNAVFFGKPFIEKVISIAGDVNKTSNLLVRFGTPLKHAIDYCGGIKGAADKIIINGPLSGISVYDESFPLTKDANSILLDRSTATKEGDCIRCGKCLEICPTHLSPMLLAAYTRADRYDECRQAHIGSCIECGACAYICPSGIPLLQYIKIAKSELAKKVAK